MVSGAYGGGIQVMGSFFAFFIIGLDIPLFSVLTRYNLVHSGMCSDWMANLLVVWIPWYVKKTRLRFSDPSNLRNTCLTFHRNLTGVHPGYSIKGKPSLSFWTGVESCLRLP